MLSTAIGYLLIGLCAGMLGRLLLPEPPSMGWLVTAAIGVAGSVVGGSLTNLVIAEGALALTTTGLYGSALGALGLLVVGRAVLERRGAN